MNAVALVEQAKAVKEADNAIKAITGVGDVDTLAQTAVSSALTQYVPGGIVISYLLDELYKFVHEMLNDCISYVPSFVDPTKVAKVLARAQSDRKGLVRDIAMDIFSYIGWEWSTWNYEPATRGNRIAGRLADFCQWEGVHPYEIALLRQRIAKRFGNNPVATSWGNSANANKANYSGFLVNPNWTSGKVGSSVNTGETVATSSNGTLIAVVAIGALFLLTQKKK